MVTLKLAMSSRIMCFKCTLRPSVNCPALIPIPFPDSSRCLTRRPTTTHFWRNGHSPFEVTALWNWYKLPKYLLAVPTLEITSKWLTIQLLSYFHICASKETYLRGLLRGEHLNTLVGVIYFFHFDETWEQFSWVLWCYFMINQDKGESSKYKRKSIWNIHSAALLSNFMFIISWKRCAW